MDQHYITRAYLRAFCDPTTPAGHTPSLWLTDLREGTVKRRAPKNVAVKVDYYSVRRDDGKLDDSAERLLSLIESSAIPIIERVVRGQFALTAEDREQLSIFLGFLITRTPGYRDYMERAAGKVGESMIRTISRHPKYFRRIVREAGIDTMTEAAIEDARVRGLEPERHFVVRGTEDFSLGQALKLALTPARYIKDMCWEL